MKKLIIITLVFALAACSHTQSGNGRTADGMEIWTVASETVNCVGVAPQRCLLIKPDGEAGWQFFYGGIDGFDYEPGYEYVISVSRETVPNPPMDASAYRYRLGKIISKERKNSADIPDSNHIIQ